MKKETTILFLTLLIFGILVNVPVVLADQGNGSGNNSENVGYEDEADNRNNSVISPGQAKQRVREMTTAQIQEAVHTRNRLRLNQSEIPENCTKTGSVIKCDIEGGRIMAVIAGQSGNTILKVNGVNMTTKAELYHHNGEVYGSFRDNETKLINYFPDQIREMIRERINATIVGNESIELNEDGEYKVEVKKRARFLGIFKVKEKVRFHIDPETGEILNIRAPWWGFLAIDEKD